MSKEALLSVVIDCSAPDRYRRAGIGFKRGEQTVEVTKEQLDVLKADPRLKVMDAPKAKTTAKSDAAKSGEVNA